MRPTVDKAYRGNFSRACKFLKIRQPVLAALIHKASGTNGPVWHGKHCITVSEVLHLRRFDKDVHLVKITPYSYGPMSEPMMVPVFGRV